MARRRSTARTRTTRFLVFTGLMIVLQALGAWLFPDRWTGARDPLTIVGVSLLSGVIYVVLTELLNGQEKRQDRARATRPSDDDGTAGR